jgi:hypothetical protein
MAVSGLCAPAVAPLSGLSIGGKLSSLARMIRHHRLEKWKAIKGAACKKGKAGKCGCWSGYIRHLLLIE